MAKITRRKFIAGSATAAAVIAGARVAISGEKKRSAVDRVTLGKTGIQLSRLGFGTGSQGGRIQRELGQAEFDRLVRHAHAQGIRYFDTADNYRIHSMLRSALKGLPREQLFIQTKIPIKLAAEIPKALDRFRKELGMDYFDSVLIHCTRRSDWPKQLERMRDALSKAKDKKIIRAHGMSCHGLQGLRAAPDCDWVDVGLVRINPQGKHVDGPTGNWNEPGDVPKALSYIKQLHAGGKGVIGMKIIGNGSFTNPADREKSIRFVMGLDCVDAIVIGFASPKEIDEAIEQINLALRA